MLICGLKRNLSLWIPITVLLFFFLSVGVASGAQKVENISKLKGISSPSPVASPSFKGDKKDSAGEVSKNGKDAAEAGAVSKEDPKTEEPEKSDEDWGLLKGETASGKGETPAAVRSGTVKAEEAEYGWKPDPERGNVKINWLVIIGSLVLVSLVAYGGIWVYFNFFGGNQPSLGLNRKLLRVRDRQVLGPNKQICLVDIPGKTVLLGISETDIKILTEIDPEALSKIEENLDNAQSPRPAATSYLSGILTGKYKDSGDNQA